MNQPRKSRTGRKATLCRMVMPDHVCPFGLKSKDLLERDGWEVDDLLKYFGKPVPDPDATSYRPVVAIFATAFLLALATRWTATDLLLSLRTLEWFVAFAMCLLGLQKLKDLESFSKMYVLQL